ncbi:hypothetical protein [Mesorhizobium sp. STM 4661]|uniref:hypothetical protein n=1 Tax=Mesorhizobium sp. STM 4661 TaxID=1297570 RepID=UPI0002BE5466|nr:hypothetical protein [Mesorhizobium sp. STM 4661]CCV11626.1 hypothetical protein MESS4_330175 [Mesorhizobium sp. STM 4661]
MNADARSKLPERREEAQLIFKPPMILRLIVSEVGVRLLQKSTAGSSDRSDGGQTRRPFRDNAQGIGAALSDFLNRALNLARNLKILRNIENAAIFQESQKFPNFVPLSVLDVPRCAKA